jgi:hypothetical protein
MFSPFRLHTHKGIQLWASPIVKNSDSMNTGGTETWIKVILGYSKFRKMDTGYIYWIQNDNVKKTDQRT